LTIEDLYDIISSQEGEIIWKHMNILIG
jgi:hypothetical protein